MPTTPDPDEPWGYADPTILGLLELHGFRAGWLAQDLGRGYFGVDARGHRLGRWNCACGEGGPLQVGEGITEAHRQHLAKVLTHQQHDLVQAALRLRREGEENDDND